MTTPPNYPPPGPYGPGQPPYGAQPPPYGQPGRQQGWGQQQPTPPGWAAPQPPYQAPGPQQMPPMPKSGKAPALAAIGCVGIVVLIIAGIVVAGLIAGVDAPAQANPGKCIKIKSASVADAEIEKVDCGAQDAAFKVAKNLDSGSDACPSGDYVEYSETGRRRSNGFKLCLVLNAAVGDCFKDEGSLIAAKISKVTCGPDASFKVSKVKAAPNDGTLCEVGETEEVYSDPATTMCLVKP